MIAFFRKKKPGSLIRSFRVETYFGLIPWLFSQSVSTARLPDPEKSALASHGDMNSH